MLEPLGNAYRYQSLMASSWYPIEWYRDAFGAFRRATGKGLELARDIGRLAARHDMRGVGWDENLWNELVGSCESLLTIAGGQHVRSRMVSGGGNGDQEMITEAHWA